MESSMSNQDKFSESPLYDYASQDIYFRWRGLDSTALTKDIDASEAILEILRSNSSVQAPLMVAGVPRVIPALTTMLDYRLTVEVGALNAPPRTAKFKLSISSAAIMGLPDEVAFERVN